MLIEPIYIIALGLLIALGGVIWLLYRGPQIQTKIETVTVTVPATPPITTLTRLEATIPPPISNDVAQLGARFLLLHDLIAKAKKAKDSIANNGPIVRDAMKPPRPIPPSGPVMKRDPIFEMSRREHERIKQQSAKQSWDQALAELQTINDSAYKNRPIDLKSAPDLAITTLTAPDEDIFGNADEAAQRAKHDYRTFHFLIRNVEKKADALIKDLNNEESKIKTELEKNAEGRDFIRDQQ